MKKKMQLGKCIFIGKRYKVCKFVPAYKPTSKQNSVVISWSKCANIFTFSNIKISRAKRQSKHDFVKFLYCNVTLCFFNY